MTTVNQTMSKPVENQALAEPRVIGETTYDRVTSFLMAVVLGAILVVGWLALIYATSEAYASRVTAPLQIIEVFGGGGGDPEGTPGSTEKVDVAGADAAPTASNNEEQPASDFEEPSVQQAPGAIIDAVAEAGETLAELDLGAVMPRGGATATGKRASKIGSGGPGLGFGPGDGGVSREQRWSIIYKSDRASTNTPVSSTHLASSWRLPPGKISSFTSEISPVRSPTSGMEIVTGKTGFTSSGKGEVEKPQISIC